MGAILFTGETIRDGQNVGGQEIGTVWGQGAYVAPDWSADYLHRQSVIVLDDWARRQGFANFEAMRAESRAALQGRLTDLTRHNTYDPATDTIMLDQERAKAFDELAKYYADVYGNGRNEYAIPAGALFAFGAIVLGWFVLGLKTGDSFDEQDPGKNQYPLRTRR